MSSMIPDNISIQSQIHKVQGFRSSSSLERVVLSNKNHLKLPLAGHLKNYANYKTKCEEKC